MKKLLLFTAALLCAASMWAGDNYKTWTMGEMRSLTCARNLYTSISYNSLDNTHWGTITYDQHKSHGRGYIVTGSSPTQTMNAVFVLWSHDESVPSYTRRRCTWKFSLYTVSTKHHATMCLYGMPDNVDALKALPVDFTAHYDDHAGSEYLLAQTTNMRQDGSGRFADYYRTLDFDNRTGSTEQTKKWYIMTTHVTGSGNGKSDLNEWGKLFSDDWYNDKTPGYWYAIEDLYYKYITFNANGGEGSMEEQVVENSANLTANTFTRTGFTFAGWATSADGAVAYTDGSEITATSDSKGPVTLYAKWTRNTYSIEYNLKGGTATNPSTYNVETATFTLTNPTKTDYTFLGWTGSNGDVPQTEVTISQGSTGNKTYKANWQFTTAYLIDAIPTPIKHNDACRDAIIAALNSYLALSDEQKAQMTAADLEKLQAAEDTYAEMGGGRSISFVDKEGETIRSQMVELEYPTAPVIEGFTFLYWQPIAEDISAGTIRIQAVYKSNTPTAIDSPTTNDERLTTNKFIRQGNLYILKDEFIYTINGQRIK